MKKRTKLDHERNKRLLMFACSMIAVIAFSCAYIGVMKNRQNGITTSEIFIMCIFILAVTVLSLGYLFSANDNYRVYREEVIKHDGAMPFSKTYYIVEHHVLFWWINCRSSKGKTIRFRSKKEAYDMMNAKIREWNSPYVPHGKRTRKKTLDKKTST